METTLNCKTPNGFVPLTYTVEYMIPYVHVENFFLKSNFYKQQNDGITLKP